MEYDIFNIDTTDSTAGTAGFGFILLSKADCDDFTHDKNKSVCLELFLERSLIFWMAAENESALFPDTDNKQTRGGFLKIIFFGGVKLNP